MNSIWKYALEVNDEQYIDAPAGALSLCVQTQKGNPCIWFKVDPYKPKEKRRIITHGTGHSVPGTTGDYIGSYQLKDGDLVFHVFESAV